MRRFWFAAVVLSFLLSACATPFVAACRRVATDPQKEFKYTERQAAVACDRAQFYADPHLVIYQKDKDRWELNPHGLLTSDLEKMMSDQAKSLDDLLSYKNRRDADWIDWFTGFRRGLEKEEAVILEILRRLKYVKAYNEFRDAVGDLPVSMQPEASNYFFPAGRKFYSMRVLYPVKRITDLPFTAEYLETAKRDGKLRLVDTFEVASSQEFAKKIPDLYDPNAFNWEKQVRGWAVKSYKVMVDNDKPADNITHFIEVYRKKRDASGYEDKPAVQGFMAAGGTKVTIFVVDYDREGTQGYGSPDEVVRIFTDITTGKDIFADSMLRTKLLESLYESPQYNPKDKPERKKPKDRVIYAAIVKMGEASLDVWEKGSWSVPFEYKTLSQNLELEYKKPKTPEEKRLEEKEKLKRIKFFIREFKQDGRKSVIEYWIPKEEYSGQNIASSFAGTDVFTIRRRGGTEERAEIQHFAAHPKFIDYWYGGKWFRIADEDGDGVFEKKREIADPSNSDSSSSAARYYGI